MSTPTIPTAEQLAATRSALWHQNGNALLTLESLRAWINEAGLVLYTRRPQQLPAPAPTLVEAVLGSPNSEPTPAELEQARTLMARLIAEGSAVPLNLLGSTSDVPDYVCSAAVFSYVFTLRGDKTWKQAPATMGAVKVSPLGLAAYEAIARRVTLTAAELATDLGKEVTETAVLRGLSELWSHLRVLPVPQQDGSVMWELMSTRLTKQMKAGGNAGQPTALSALISLYLGMTVVATEEEIETILSPLAPRSRIRDVVHALMGARQLETMAIDGRTVVHLTGDLPSFGSPAGVEADATGEGVAEGDVEGSAVGLIAVEGAGERISKFVPRPKKVGTGKVGTGFARKFPARPEADRERRPFQKKTFGAPEKPSFTRPWNEGRAGADAGKGGAPADKPRARFDAPGRPGFGAKPAFGSKPSFDGKPKFGGKPGFGDGPRPSAGQGGTRPTFRRDAERGPAEDRPRREYAPRNAEGGVGEGRAPRKTFGGKPAFGGKPGIGARAPYSGKPAFGGKPAGARKDEGRERPSFGGPGESRPPRRDFTARPESGSRPGGERRPGSYAARPQGEGFTGRKPPYAGKPSGGSGFSRTRDEASGPEGPRKVFRKFDAPRFDKPRFDKAAPGAGERGDRPQRAVGGGGSAFRDRAPGGGGYAGKPGGFAGKKPFGKPGSRPPGTFAKFADGAQPFKRPFAGKPGGSKFAGKPATGPTFRKRKPEEGETA